MIGPPPATPRAFSGKVESGGIPKEARIGFKIPTGTRGASREWRSDTPTTCVNAPSRRLNPRAPAKKLPSCTTWLQAPLADSSGVSAKQAVSARPNLAATSACTAHRSGQEARSGISRIARITSLNCGIDVLCLRAIEPDAAVGTHKRIPTYWQARF